MTESISPTSPDPVPAIRLASAPFDKPEADIVLRSVDGVDFCVRRHILFEASPVFESILSIPQPSADPRPIVHLAEDQKTLDTILRICYPIVKVKSSLQLEEVERAMKAAQKYDMELPLAVLTDELLELAKTSPFAVWAVGCRTGLEHVARHAATILKKRLKVEVVHLDGVSAGDYFRLLDFHRKGRKVPSTFRFLTSGEASTTESTPTASIALPIDMPHPHPDVDCVSSDFVEISAHKVCVAAASPILQERIDKTSKFTDAGHPILTFSEPSRLLADLLRLCYPDRKPSDLPSDPSKLADILVALDAYKMGSIRGAVFDFWKTVAEESPIRAYIAAARSRLQDCMAVAAKNTLQRPLEGQYVAEMECSPAAAYHHLLVYHASCRAAAKQAFRDVLLSPASKSSSNSELHMDSALATVFQRAVLFARQQEAEEARMSRSRAGAVTQEPTSTTTLAQDAWLESYVESLIAKADNHCYYAPLSPTALDAALAEEHLSLWCNRCRVFARKLSAVDAAVQSIQSRIAQVSLVF